MMKLKNFLDTIGQKKKRRGPERNNNRGNSFMKKKVINGSK